MQALLAIDEGLRSPGVAALRQSLMDSGLGVVTLGANCRDAVAGKRPEGFTFTGGDFENPIYELDASPIDCVHVALGGGLGGDVDVVITGFGRPSAAGELAGGDVVFAAAKEAALMGRPAISMMLGFSPGASAGVLFAEVDFNWCGVVVSELAAWMVASPVPAGSVLSVSVPPQVLGRGLQLAGPSGGLAHADGHIRVTPFGLDGASDRPSTRLLAWCEEAIASINPRLGVSDGRCQAGCCG